MTYAVTCLLLHDAVNLLSGNKIVLPNFASVAGPRNGGTESFVL
jgi:hypothetical protein